jgi:DNA-binding NtrC family response regulator
MEVLLVEDNSEVSLITVEYLTELGHSTVAVPAAESALARLAERNFDAVMTDVSLPGMSGIDLAKELSKQYPKLPVVISSGYGSVKLEFGLGRRQPNVFFLPKPYDLPMLEKTLSEAAAFSAPGQSPG